MGNKENISWDQQRIELLMRPDSELDAMMTSEFREKTADEVPYLKDVAEIFFNSYYEKDGLSSSHLASFLYILGELHGKYIQSAKQSERPPLDKQAMIEEAYTKLKRVQLVNATVSQVALSGFTRLKE